MKLNNIGNLLSEIRHSRVTLRELVWELVWELVCKESYDEVGSKVKLYHYLIASVNVHSFSLVSIYLTY